MKFTSSVIPAYTDEKGKRRSTVSPVYVPPSLVGQSSVDMLVFFHGNDACLPYHRFDPENIIKNFALDKQIDNATRKAVLAVPSLYWKLGTLANISGIWSAKRLNVYVEETLDQIGVNSGVRPDLNRLILVGHSRAFAILTPLARQFVNDNRDTTIGALAKLEQVCWLDATYGFAHAEAVLTWSNKLPKSNFSLVLFEPQAKQNCIFNKNEKNRYPIKYWDCFMKKKTSPQNLNVKKVPQRHCEIPNLYVQPLLS